MTGRSLSVMQPYVFPYVGYFHLIEASDVFVFYDDVSYRPRTWMNRNRILIEGAPHTFTVPVRGGSQNSMVRDVAVLVDARWRRKFESTLAQAYHSAPHFREVSDLVGSVLDGPPLLVDFAIRSIEAVYAYVGESFTYTRSSEVSPESAGSGRSARLFHLAHQVGCSRYLNLPGGRHLYTGEKFHAAGLDLGFVDSRMVEYDQHSGRPFVPDLSVLDLLMFNSPEVVREILSAYNVTMELAPGRWPGREEATGG